MSESIVDTSRAFFEEVVKPILESHFPEITAVTAFGLFGYGSEALGLDDDYSRDHHWGVRIDGLLPGSVTAEKQQEIITTVSANLPESYRGHSLYAAHLTGAGLALDTLPHFLQRTIGLTRAPQTNVEWLHIPEEDIVHVINGEVWHDGLGKFTAVRQTLNQYYPEPVRLRRIAHWCRYFSGMGSYALKRAILRNNAYYAAITSSRAVKWAIQRAFMLERTYYPYDKWLMSRFARLPRLATPLKPLVDEAVSLSTSWPRKLALLDEMSDVLDRFMVADGVIAPHPRFAASPTSGYRLLEHAYAEIIKKLPAELKPVIPVWEQVHWESFHSQFVDDITMADWDKALQLKPDNFVTRFGKSR
jgi:hypothetical protein